MAFWTGLGFGCVIYGFLLIWFAEKIADSEIVRVGAWCMSAGLLIVGYVYLKTVLKVI